MHRPWQLRGSPAIVKLGKHIQIISKVGECSQGPIFQQLQAQAREIYFLSPGALNKIRAIWRQKWNMNRFIAVMDGMVWLAPIQYGDNC